MDFTQYIECTEMIQAYVDCQIYKYPGYLRIPEIYRSSRHSQSVTSDKMYHHSMVNPGVYPEL